jgi:hypothetical protein
LNAKKRFEPESEFLVFLPDVVFTTAVARSAGYLAGMQGSGGTCITLDSGVHQQSPSAPTSTTTTIIEPFRTNDNIEYDRKRTSAVAKTEYRRI